MSTGHRLTQSALSQLDASPLSPRRAFHHGSVDASSGSQASSPINIPSPGGPLSPAYDTFQPDSLIASSSSSSSSGSHGFSSRHSAARAPPAYDGAPASRQQAWSPPPPTSYFASPPDWHSSHFAPSRRSPRSQQRRFSAGSHGNAGLNDASTTPFGSLVGSYENSLLSGRLSALPSLPMPFLASIGVLGSSQAPSKLRCPPHLNIPFGAFFYAGSSGTHGQSSSPYVGTIDLEAHYLSTVAAHPSAPRASLPRFPGYRVPEQGQLQIVIKNDNSTAIKVFLVPYDLAGLSRGGLGGKTFLRQKSYTVVPDAVAPPLPRTHSESSQTTPPRDSSKGSLRYAIHLQFCSPPVESQPPTSVQSAYYLHQTIRVVFAPSRALEFSERLYVVAETPGLLRQHDAHDGVSPYRGPPVEWDMARRKAKAREKVAAVQRAESSDSEPKLTPSLAPRTPSPQLRPGGPLLSTPPSMSPLGSSSLPSSLVSSPSPPDFCLSDLRQALTPVELSTTAPTVSRRPLFKSGLSTSRPSSPAFRQSPSPPPVQMPSDKSGALIEAFRPRPRPEGGR